MGTNIPMDLTGNKFGYLTAIRMSDVRTPKTHRIQWECVCECGKQVVIPAHKLRGGETKSCGCHKYDCNHRSKKAKNNPRLYNIYRGMKKRCENPTHYAYKDYGGRGITICDEWEKFGPFCDWALANGYDPNASAKQCTLDRIDNSKGYSPDNCRWTTMLEQNNNKRNNKFLTYNGKTQTVAEWSRECGLKSNVIAQRLHRGWSVEKTLSTPQLWETNWRKTSELGRQL